MLWSWKKKNSKCYIKLFISIACSIQTHDSPTGDEDEQSSRTHSATHFGGVGAALDTQGMTIGDFPFFGQTFYLSSMLSLLLCTDS